MGKNEWFPIIIQKEKGKRRKIFKFNLHDQKKKRKRKQHA